MREELKLLGYDQFIAQQMISLGLEEEYLARVVAEFQGIYRIKNIFREANAKITGKMKFDAVSKEDYPAVGDWVLLANIDEDQPVIQRILERKTVLKRKSAHGSDIQLMASNIDIAFIVQSVDENYNLNRFERYYTIVEDSGIKAVFILNKIDLIAEDILSKKIEEIRERFPDVKLLVTSTVSKEGIEKLQETLVKGFTHCFIGSSGVGKTSLINMLFGENLLDTDEISEHTGKGKHTTTNREMFFLSNGAIVIDNPGMREMGVTDSMSGIEQVFSEINELALKCKFLDCTHIHEPGCAVQEAIKSGALDESKFENYLNLKKEAEYLEMTKLEKKRKDKKFGKMCKEVMQYRRKKKF